MLSTISSKRILSIAKRPAYVLALAAAAPPNCAVSASWAALKSLVLIMFSSSGTPNFFSAVKLPSYALPMAVETWAKSLPVAFEASILRVSNSCAFVASPVNRTKPASAGRSSSSATPVANCVWSTKSAMLSARAWLGPSVARSCVSKSLVLCSSAIAALAAIAKPPASAVTAPAAGTIAFLSRNPLLAPKPCRL